MVTAIRMLTLVVFVGVVAGAPAAQASGDVDAPQITSAGLGGTRAEPGDTVVLSWAGADVGDGIGYVSAGLRSADGALVTSEQQYATGSAPTSGTLTWTLPPDATVGVYQVMWVRVVDGACNATKYTPSAGGVGTQRVVLGDCGDPYVDAEPTAAVDVTPLVLAVGMDLPLAVAPAPPTQVHAAVDGDVLTVTWATEHPYQPVATAFSDWSYDVEVDGVVVRDPTTWPARQATTVLSPLSGGHTVTVRSSNRFGTSGLSDVLTFDGAAPRVVSALTSRGALSGARVRWMPPSSGQTPAAFGLIDVTGLHGPRFMTKRAVDRWVTSTRARSSDHPRGESYTVGVVAMDAEGQRGPVSVVRMVGTRLRLARVVPVGADPVARGTAEAAGTRQPLPYVPLVPLRAPTVDPDAWAETALRVRTDRQGRYSLAHRARAGYRYRIALVGQPGLGGSWVGVG